MAKYGDRLGTGPFYETRQWAGWWPSSSVPPAPLTVSPQSDQSREFSLRQPRRVIGVEQRDTQADFSGRTQDVWFLLNKHLLNEISERVNKLQKL